MTDSINYRSIQNPGSSWTLCCEHYKRANCSLSGLAHLIISIFEAIPLFGRLVSLADWYWCVNPKAMIKTDSKAKQVVNTTLLLKVEQAKDPKVENFNKIKSLADKGAADAQFIVGRHYELGLIVEKNLEEAFKYYTRAAEKKLATAQRSLGICYEFGRGVEKDPIEAVKWYRLAADQGSPYAQFNLGQCYELGTGIEQNLEEAIKYYKLSADQGYEEAKDALKRL